MKTPQEIAAAFTETDVHDDTVESFRVIPARNRRGSAKLEIDLFRHWEGRRRRLSINGCVNISLALDTTILADNAPSNTARLEAHSDIDAMIELVTEHKTFWNVEYDNSIDPLPKKLKVLGGLVLFKVRLFGGTLVILARSFRLSKLPALSTDDAPKKT